MKDKIVKIIIALMLVFNACSLDGDLEDPNQINIGNADVDLIMNSVQLSFSNFFNDAERSVNPLCRMEAMTGGFRYQTANTPESVNALWSYAYEDVLVNAELVIKLAEEKNLTTHVAVAKILSAYVYLTLVDIFGDVPQAEALQAPQGNFNPRASTGEEVYRHAIQLLTEAKAELAKTGTDAGAALSRDNFYGGNRARWNALANSLELKAWLNFRMFNATEANPKITTLLTSDLIDTEAENFTYKYGTAIVPVSQHPVYRQYYTPGRGGAGGYIANYFMYEMYTGYGLEDPRWRYYFYRQVGSIARALEVDPKSLGCAPGAPPPNYIAAGVPVFCVFDPGFYGRDHGDGFGIPPDGPVLTCAGVYPAGGRADNNLAASYWGATIQGEGANGAGIHPIFMSFFTDFMKAEIKLRAGDAVGARVDLENGVRKSITQVKNFAASKGQTLLPGRESSTDAYVAAVLAAYDAATTKLDVVGREFYISCWGNGVEAYNNLRRTSAPRNLQPALQPNPGPFYRSYVYPADYVNLNQNASQKDFNSTNKIFWDTNPDVIN
ncbi:MAG: SusD/RagB family nutrient-binding outer membrane lipoprotein [Cyclobacteriaceae bacterium]|nr:SusD/RagB family nutrient-binding outer membrane lipoprotein [Cyclobacteriaceae bacterium]UYN86526.1 MAG: SusD/RagB family nutrient-binding outer membrane lipoprotein [Cyclobacteriaceae bacterium]